VALLAAVEVEAFGERARQAFEWQMSLAGTQAQVSKGSASKQEATASRPNPTVDHGPASTGNWVPRVRSGPLFRFQAFGRSIYVRIIAEATVQVSCVLPMLYDRLNPFITIVCLTSIFHRRLCLRSLASWILKVRPTTGRPDGH
jgi:hypothetical protein